jgi:hypothetical protein
MQQPEGGISARLSVFLYQNKNAGKQKQSADRKQVATVVRLLLLPKRKGALVVAKLRPVYHASTTFAPQSLRFQSISEV